MNAARRVRGGVAVSNGNRLALARGNTSTEGQRRMDTLHGQVPHPLLRETGAFIAAVFIGSLGGLMAAQLLGPWLGRAAAGTLALALGTTLTGAAHARLIHRQAWRSLIPRVLVAAPLAYGVMSGVHGLLGR